MSFWRSRKLTALSKPVVTLKDRRAYNTFKRPLSVKYCGGSFMTRTWLMELAHLCLLVIRPLTEVEKYEFGGSVFSTHRKTDIDWADGIPWMTEHAAKQRQVAGSKWNISQGACLLTTFHWLETHRPAAAEASGTCRVINDKGNSFILKVFFLFLFIE